MSLFFVNGPTTTLIYTYLPTRSLYDALPILLEEAVTQGRDAYVLGGHVLLGDTEGFAHADNLVGRQGAGAHATFVTAAVHGRLDANTRLARSEEHKTELQSLMRHSYAVFCLITT